jgi:hypothetical protein
MIPPLSRTQGKYFRFFKKLLPTNDRFLAPSNRVSSTVGKLALAFWQASYFDTVFWQGDEERMAIFGYGRVSTSQQDTENQRLELEQAGGRSTFGLLMLLAVRFRLCVKHFLKCSAKSAMVKHW